MTPIPHSEQFDDIYFAVEDGLAESRYVFLEQNSLPALWMDKSHFIIAETGFGTGLNFLCAWTAFEKTAPQNNRLHYYSFEKFPLSAKDIQKYLSHWSGEFDGRLEKLVGAYPLRVSGWHTLRVSERVTLTLIFDDVNKALPEMKTEVDCWFLDGHAPAKNPDMWSDNVFHHIGKLSIKGTRFATFTAAGFVRRGLEAVGFTVSKARGFGQKRDMSIGVFAGNKLRSPPQKHYQRIAVIGGGIAGATMAHALYQRGRDVILFEKNALASGGSGNVRGLANPRITALREFESDFYGAALARAESLFRTLSSENDIGYSPCGSLHLITDSQKEKRYTLMTKNWGWHSDHARVVDSAEASAIAGIPLNHGALFLPDAAMVSPHKTVTVLAKNISVRQADANKINYDGDIWHIEDDSFDAVVLAGAHDVGCFPQLDFLPLQKVRGQVTEIQLGPNYTRLKTNLCYGGYASAPFDGGAVIGSTFQHWLEDASPRTADDEDNLEKLASVAPHLIEDIKVTGARVGFRCAAKDRLPVIGAVSGYKGLYVSAAHGSHGILSGIMGAEILATEICGDGAILPQSALKTISPQRFSKN